MAGKYLKRGAIIDTLKSEQRTNAVRKRAGLTAHPITVTSCGCPDPNCGAWHTIETERIIPKTDECKLILATGKKRRKRDKTKRKSAQS
jgi:hypothetical protein